MRPRRLLGAALGHLPWASCASPLRSCRCVANRLGSSNPERPKREVGGKTVNPGRSASALPSPRLIRVGPAVAMSTAALDNGKRHRVNSLARLVCLPQDHRITSRPVAAAIDLRVVKQPLAVVTRTSSPLRQRADRARRGEHLRCKTPGALPPIDPFRRTAISAVV